MKNIAIILLSLLLVGLTIREKYPQRIAAHLRQPPPPVIKKPYSYLDNRQYPIQVGYQELYHRKGQIVMMGTSLSFLVQWGELLDRGDVLTRAVGGDVTAGYFPRLKYVLDCEPKAVFLEGGINDLINGISEDTIIEHFASLIDTFQHRDINVAVSSIIHVTRGYAGGNINPAITRCNNLLEKLCETKHVYFINIDRQLSPSGYLQDHFAYRDGVHLTAPAYDQWRGQILSALQNFNL